MIVSNLRKKKLNATGQTVSVWSWGEPCDPSDKSEGVTAGCPVGHGTVNKELFSVYTDYDGRPTADANLDNLKAAGFPLRVEVGGVKYRVELCKNGKPKFVEDLVFIR